MLAAACCAPLGALAQAPEPTLPATPAAPARPPLARDVLAERERLRTSTAERIARTALLRLRTTVGPDEDDFRIAALHLGLALHIDPSSEEILRRQITAWKEAGDEERHLRATRALLELCPTDTVAQLRLLTAGLNKIQLAELRLAAYDRLLGPLGDKVDPAIRSRIALDAALVARERGDDRGYVERLSRATAMDSSNKEAAVLAAATFLERSDDPLGRVEMLANVLLADPVDPSASLNLARELRSHGAFKSAARLQENAEFILRREGAAPDDDTFTESMLSLWQAGATREFLTTLQNVENVSRERRRQEIQYLEMSGQPTGPPIEQFRLPIAMEVLRFAANLSLDEREAALASLRAIIQEAGAEVERMKAPAEGVAPLTPDEITARTLTHASNMLWLGAWLGANPDETQASLDAAETSDRLLPDAVSRYRGWIAIARGEMTTARELLSPLAQTDAQARLGLARIAELEGATRLAAQHYAVVLSRQPDSMLGRFARQRIETLLGAPVEPTPVARELEAYASRLPPWLDDMARAPTSYLFLDVKPIRDTANVIDGAWVDITLQNTGRTALAIGPSAPIPSRLLLTPDIGVQGRGQNPDAMQPEIIDLDRRVRLASGETLRARVWAGQGFVGDLIDSLGVPLTLRWRGTLNFLPDAQGRLMAGPFSVTADAGIMTRPIIQSLGMTPEAIQHALGAAQGDTLLEAIFFARTIILLALTDPNNAETQTISAALTTAMATRVPSMSEVERAATVAIVTTAHPETRRTPLDEIAEADPSPFVRLVWLATRRPPGADEAYRDALADPNPEWAELASLLATRKTPVSDQPAVQPVDAGK